MLAVRLKPNVLWITVMRKIAQQFPRLHPQQSPIKLIHIVNIWISAAIKLHVPNIIFQIILGAWKHQSAESHTGAVSSYCDLMLWDSEQILSPEASFNVNPFYALLLLLTPFADLMTAKQKKIKITFYNFVGNTDGFIFWLKVNKTGQPGHMHKYPSLNNKCRQQVEPISELKMLSSK